MIKLENAEVYGWKAVKGYEGCYMVSQNGEIFSIRSNKSIRPFVSSGYFQIELNRLGKAKKYLVHRIVAEAFIPNPNNLPCVNHKDGNKLNNNVSNLEWCTFSENMVHASRNGLLKTLGSNNPASKLTESQVNWIKRNYRKGDKVFGQSALGKRFGVDHKTIAAIVEGRTWNYD